MFFTWRYLLIVLVLDSLPGLITGLEINEGETLTLTCPRPSRTFPVEWEGPPRYQHFTRGLQVSLELPAETRARVSLSGDHANGFYNLQIDSVRKSDSGSYRCKIGPRRVRHIRVRVKTQEEQNQGLFPYILNLATRSRISTNATCGEDQPEYFCKLVEHVDLIRITHCDNCNARAHASRPQEIGTAHPISNAIDGSNLWWQSPSISNGWEYNYVTITLDLGLIYQVAYVVVKAANAPRPGNWILEKSLDGLTYSPWQYFAITDEDCERIYNVRAAPGKPSYDYLRDDEVRCTSHFSKLNPVQNGEIFISLTNGRPGIFVPSKTLLDFTSARYVRLRFQKIRTLNADLMSLQARDPRNLDPSVTRRYFYSVKDVSIGGQCICYGHASECQRQGDSDRLACVCQHNTCGDNCETCCPLFNQKPWQRGGGNGNGKIIDVVCEACNCHGHADACVYNRTVDIQGLSLNVDGVLKGGGVCIDCQDDTTGINCERCIPGYYRPFGISHNSRRPCRPCNCQASVGNTGVCVEDDSQVDEGLMPGSCVCKEGFAGQTCDKCAPGYHSYPQCLPCSCSRAGTKDPDMCEGRCVCKDNVQGTNCDQCQDGYYDLSEDNDLGCRQCFCFGVSSVCQSAGLGLVQISDMRDSMDGWTVITLNDEGFMLFPTAVDGWLEYRTFPAREQNALDRSEKEVIYYWQAPMKYYGNRLTSYGGSLHYTMMFTIDESAPWQTHQAEADVILQGSNLTVTNGRNYIRENQENKKSLTLDETEWYELDSTGRQVGRGHVSRKDFMLLLHDLKRILIRATHHTAQDNVMLKDVLLDTSSAGSTSDVSISGVEKCSCPRGYTGLSCESCDIGWRRLDNILYGGTCIPCDCNGHSKTCDPYTGRCLMCTDSTEGDNCEVCAIGFYGDPSRGTPDDCKPCGCPLAEKGNNFATRCMFRPTISDPEGFVCLDCEPGYAGERCERCDHGYFGYPGLLGNYCQPCYCNGNIDREMPGSCDQLSGACRICQHNTQGNDCERCMDGYYGTAVNGDCKMCDCDPFGSTASSCDIWTGQCKCKDHYTGRQCDRCETGYGDVTQNCAKCNCSRMGSLDSRCHPVTGQCVCRPGVTGQTCDQCQEGFYRYSHAGCTDCRCYRPASNKTEICDGQTGACNCLPNVKGDHCDRCKEFYWGLELGEGCKACDCHPQGSYFQQCHSQTGQCRCKNGVTGLKCDSCIEGYYGLASGECKECQPCTKPGHICHPDTGECVCPPNTIGERCEECMDEFWGYDPKLGCKACDCNLNGSYDNACDPLSGQCACKLDYRGLHCDSCMFGFYNFPDCTLCLCSVEGTEWNSCDTQGACSCASDDGQCTCKDNTKSRTCAQCKNNTFSLDVTNPDGCTECFCFGRADKCKQAQYVWTQVLQPEMAVSFDHRASDVVLRQQNGFYKIPTNASWATIPGDTVGEPVYWRLNITGDKILSYNGDLQFTVEHGSLGNTELSDLESLKDKPLVVLIGHGLPLMYISDTVWEQDKALNFKVRLHEHYWRTQQNSDVSRTMMMVVLQNVTDILVRATWDMSAVSAKISDIELDVAVDANDVFGLPALGIEMCECPEQYSGLSCQRPAEGYYRVPNIGTIDYTYLPDIIGDVSPCFCNDHSSRCNPDTGVCYNCEHSTTGDHCDICMDGYYGNATYGTPSDCQRCACPLEVDSNNFSPTCTLIGSTLICTACDEGYAGDRCQYCAQGYFGDPSTPGATCEECLCNPEGSVTGQCDDDGKCQCLPGILGDKCDECQARHAVVSGQCISCDIGCTRSLMIDLDELNNMTRDWNFDPSNIQILAPYLKLSQINNETKILSERLEKLQYAKVIDVEDELKILAMEVEAAGNRSEDLIAKSEQNQDDGADLLQSANGLEQSILDQQTDVEGLVDELEETVAKQFHNRSGINVTAALAEASEILTEIKDRDFSDNENMVSTENNSAEKLLRQVEELDMRVVNRTDEVWQKVDALKKALEDLLEQESNGVKVVEETNRKLSKFPDILERIKQYVNESVEMNETLVDTVEEARWLVENATAALNRTKENVMTLETRVSTLDAAMIPLSDKQENLNMSMPNMERRVDDAWAHANNLMDRADRLEKLFESTRNAAADPLKAAHVYENIVSAIEEADQAARKAIIDADNATSIARLDELGNSVDDSLKRSRELLDQANTTLKGGVKGLSDALSDVNKDLDKLEENQISTIDKHTSITDKLDKLPANLVDRLSDVKTSLDDTNTAAKNVGDRTDKMVEKVNDELLPKLDEIRNVVEDDYQDVYVSLRGIKKNLGEIQNLTDSTNRRIQGSVALRSDLADKLSKLKQSIREAREEANKVKLSLNAEGECVKKFRSMTQPGTLNMINFAFKTSEPQKDMLIILVQNKDVNEGDDEKEFLAVELKNRRIRFSWNVGGGTAFIDDDTEIKADGTIIRETGKWYKVIAQRIGRLGRLTVHNLDKEPGIPKTKASKVGYTLMNLSTDTDLYISGVPQEYVVPDGVTSFNFSGCMGSVYIDDQLVGLSNFETNTIGTCKACLEVPTQAPGANLYTFDGTGYAVSDKVRITKPIIASIAMEFSTYWENATLFFVGNMTTGEYMSLELVSGLVVFQYYLGMGTYGRLESKQKYNHNSWVSVSVGRNGYFALLQVGTEQGLIEANKGDYIFRAEKSNLFFGGIPPTVDMDVYEQASGRHIVTDRFLGCMKGIQLSLETVNLWDAKTTVGVSEGCKDSGLRSVGFYGEGFAEFPGGSLDSAEADLSVSFTSFQEDALLLLAKNINGDNYYSLSLFEGSVVGLFSGGGGKTVEISSSEKFNDGVVHNIAVKKTDRKLEIYVDDKVVGDGRLLRLYKVILVREDGGGLYLGGIPSSLKIDGMAPTEQSLHGCISDVVINGKVLNINKPKQYDKADIGRCSLRPAVQNDGSPAPVASDAPAAIRMASRASKPTKQPKTARMKDRKMTSDMGIPDMGIPSSPATLAPTSCAANTGIYRYETDAFLFGEETTSFHQINVSRREIIRNFDISFEFRTFYDDGILFYLSNLDHSTFLVAQLKKGVVVVTFERKGRVKEVKVTPKQSVVDGAWHSLVVQKKKQRISVIVDKKNKRGAKIAKKLSVDIPLYVGGIPASFLPLINKKVVSHSIRGCIRNFVMNKNLKAFSDSTLLTGVDKCFVNTERGAHFTGNSYAVYVEKFRVGRELSLDLEFRTTVPEGILATVSNADGKHAMTLQLHKGQVKLSLINAGGQITAMSSFGTPFHLCSNTWHRVQADIMKNVITVQVDDNAPTTITGKDRVTKTITNAPLYIGGKPGSSNQAAALTAKGFEGCLRNVKIRERNVDWFKLVNSVAVHKTSCPMS